ncbi:DUF4038 domain-containing protein [Pseudonocardia aurantiaca]|uniref:apiosidase-like domain-containing protein n=1 Tax=Pseudonocardia aurantiaca TaxID=75290 RepID=UPI0036D39F61
MRAPFFWLADTGWEMVHRAGREDARRYLDARAQPASRSPETTTTARRSAPRTTGTGFWSSMPGRDERGRRLAHDRGLPARLPALGRHPVPG